ncbi:hypothetical protein Ancab_029962 [Ancistrocladus abbreviatus]
MSGVSAASDIWSVGCTVIELLTCVPPYFDLQPMPALFHIVQDEHPPIPDGLSSHMADFLDLCFKKLICVITDDKSCSTVLETAYKDSRQRPDAKTLLSQPWIQNNRRILQPSLPQDGAIRSSHEDGLLEAAISNGDDCSTCESPSAGNNPRREKLSKVTVHVGESGGDHGPCSIHVEEPETSEDVPSDRVPTLTIHEKPPSESGPSQVSADHNTGRSCLEEHHDHAHELDSDEVVMNCKLGSLGLRKKDAAKEEHERNHNAIHKLNSLFSFGPRSQDVSRQKVTKSGTPSGNELSKFSDTPGDASLDDLFHSLDKKSEDHGAEASASASASHSSQAAASVTDVGKHNLATKLRAAIAQKQMENERGQANAVNLFRMIMRALKEDVINVDSSLVFKEKLQGETLSPLQAVEFSRLVGSLRPEEPEDVIVSACQKLIAVFHQRPEQKIVFVTRHGLLPLMELLEVPRPRVISSVLQVINQIIKENSNFQENACLVGLIPVVMGFAVPDRPQEVRMEAAYFLQQLCQSRRKCWSKKAEFSDLSLPGLHAKDVKRGTI